MASQTLTIGVEAGIVAAIVSSLLPSPPTIRMMWTEKPHLRPWIVGSFVAAGVLIFVLLGAGASD